MQERDTLTPVWDGPEAAGSPIDLLAVMGALVSRWPFILLAGILGCVLAYAISMLLTPTFQSKAVLLPPAQRSVSTENPLAVLLAPPVGAIYPGLLSSETVLNDVIEQDHLVNLFKAKDVERARVMLRGYTQISTDAAGFITLAVSYRDARIAQAIANDYLTALERLNTRMVVTQATQQRGFYQRELEREKNGLETAEINLKRAQESSGVVLPQSQTQSGLTAIDTLRAQIRVHQVALAALLEGRTDRSPEVVQARSEIQALEGQVSRMETGAGGGAGSGLTAARAPAINLEFVRLEREVKYHQLLFDIMARQYDNAKLQEISAAPGMQVVDYPQVALYKSWPNRKIFAVVGWVVGTFCALLAIFIRNRWSILKSDPDRAPIIGAIRASFRNPKPLA